MQKPLRIAFGSADRCGKDTAAAFAAAFLEAAAATQAEGSGQGPAATPEVTRLSFAAKLYECHDAVHRALGMPPHKERALLRWLGEGLKVHYGQPGLWAGLVEQQIFGASGHVLITDLRFDVEAQMLRRLDPPFIFVEVRRPGCEPSAGLSAAPDYVLLNTGSLEDLRQAVDALLRQLSQKN